MSFSRSTVVVSVTILISRLLGCIRDAVFAYTIGTTNLNDAFTAALKLINLFRITFGDGGFSSAFIPVYSDDLKNVGAKRARATAIHAKSLLVIIVSFITLLSMLNMESIVTFTTPGFKGDRYLTQIAVKSSLILFPYALLVSISAFYGSILQGRKIFFPYFSNSIIMNLSIIAIVLLPFKISENLAYTLAFSTLIGGICEFFWIIAWAKKYKALVPFWRPKITSRSLLILRRLSLSLITTATNQINVWVNMALVSTIPGTISYIYYADRITQLPLALIGTALSSTILPNAKSFIKNCQTRMVEKCIIASLFFSIPAVFGTFSLSANIISLLFGRGKFGPESIAGTSAVLKVMIFSLPAYTLQKIFFSLFNGNDKIKCSAFVSLVVLLCNIALSFILMKKYSYMGVLYSNCISNYIGLAIAMTMMLRFRYFACRASYLFEVAKYILAGVLMFSLLEWLKAYAPFIAGNTLLMIGCGITAYLLLSLIMKVKVLKLMIRRVNKLN